MVKKRSFWHVPWLFAGLFLGQTFWHFSLCRWSMRQRSPQKKTYDVRGKFITWSYFELMKYGIGILYLYLWLYICTLSAKNISNRNNTYYVYTCIVNPSGYILPFFRWNIRGHQPHSGQMPDKVGCIYPNGFSEVEMYTIITGNYCTKWHAIDIL